MRAWMFVALAACACKASGSDDNADAASGPMGFPTYESQYCSASLSEMPLYTCSAEFTSLTCLSTYQQTVMTDGGAMMRPVFVCRFTCTPDMGCTGSDVCCAGTGMNGQTIHGCVPKNACQPAP
jgi:hypothetical protein